MAANQSKSQNSNSDGRSKNSSSNSGNFKNDPQRASEAGRKGGESRSSQDQDKRSSGRNE